MILKCSKKSLQNQKNAESLEESVGVQKRTSNCNTLIVFPGGTYYSLMGSERYKLLVREPWKIEIFSWCLGPGLRHTREREKTVFW